jgi:CheY-like chemotaxis protein
MPRKLTVLLVDDEPMIATMISSVLDEEGYEVRVCTSAHEAQNCIWDDTLHFDALITDINLNDEVGGVALADLLLTRNAAACIVFITGEVAASVASGCPVGSVILEKPFRPSQLLDALESALPQGGG